MKINGRSKDENYLKSTLNKIELELTKLRINFKLMTLKLHFLSVPRSDHFIPSEADLWSFLGFER